jgi:Bacteriophage tail tube protein
MPTPVSVDRITNANVYMDGLGLLGRAEEVEVPLPAAMMAEHKGLGMAGKSEFPAGLDKLEAKIKWASLYPEVLGGLSIYQSHSFQVRASKESYTSQGRTLEVPVVLLMTAQFKKGGPLNFKLHEQVDFPTELVVYHTELYVGGIQALLYDVLANMYIVNGVDQLANFRANIGA